MNPRGAFAVNDMFEEALREYTGAPHVAVVDSCTNALFLCLLYERYQNGPREIELPRRTYVGVAQAVLNSGHRIVWTDERWVRSYRLKPTRIIDSAKDLRRGMYGWYGWHDLDNVYACVSFQMSKALPIGRGGAILHADDGFDAWVRRARLDGRQEGQTGEQADATFMPPGHHMYMPPPDAARGLWLLMYDERGEPGAWGQYPDLEAAGIPTVLPMFDEEG